MGTASSSSSSSTPPASSATGAASASSTATPASPTASPSTATAPLVILPQPQHLVSSSPKAWMDALLMTPSSSPQLFVPVQHRPRIRELFDKSVPAPGRELKRAPIPDASGTVAMSLEESRLFGFMLLSSASIVGQEVLVRTVPFLRRWTASQPIMTRLMFTSLSLGANWIYSIQTQPRRWRQPMTVEYKQWVDQLQYLEAQGPQPITQAFLPQILPPPRVAVIVNPVAKPALNAAIAASDAAAVIASLKASRAADKEQLANPPPPAAATPAVTVPDTFFTRLPLWVHAFVASATLMPMFEVALRIAGHDKHPLVMQRMPLRFRLPMYAAVTGINTAAAAVYLPAAFKKLSTIAKPSQ